MNSVHESTRSTSENHPEIRLTRFTSQRPARLSKRFTLAREGLHKESGGNMTAGVADRLIVDLAGFAALLPTLKPNQALAYGVNGHDSAQVVTAASLVRMQPLPADTAVIARTRDHFHWPDGPGMLMVDYDPPADAPTLDCAGLRAALAAVCPALVDAPAIWRPSASSCIYSSRGEELRGIAGQRLYLPVLDAADIPRAGQALVDRLWLAGYGRVDLSQSGAALPRALIDASVFQPERLDFCGGADCGPGLIQRLPDPVLFNPTAPYLDTATALPPLTPHDRARLVEVQTAAGIAPPAQPRQRKGDYFRNVNDAALASLACWVPLLFPDARPYRGGYRVTSAALGRELEEDLSIQPEGIRDFGVADMGDPHAGKRTPIDLVMAARGLDARAAAGWLCEELGVDPVELGWKDRPAQAERQQAGSAKDDAVVADDMPDGFANGPDRLLVGDTGKSLVKHNDAADLLFQKEFGGRLFFDPIMLEWFEYQPSLGVFQHRPALAIEQAVYRAINRHCGTLGFDSAYVSGVTKCLLYEAIKTPEPAVGKICFRNGVLDIATLELLPHAPEHHFTSSLPFDWTSDAPAPAIVINWLREAVGGHDDQVQLLRAYLNAIVVGRPDLQRFLEVIGAGGSGKGTLIRLATALVGKDAVHSTSLKQLEENRFETAKIFGKKLVVINDAEKWNDDVSMLKSITGEDAVRFEQKHKQAGESFTYGGMVIIAANQHTKSTDYSSGIQRRRITVPFDHVVPATQRRDLEAEFEPHLPAVLKWVLDMPQSEVTQYLRATSLHTQSLRNARLDALAATNPMVAWMLDNVHFAENVSARIGEKKRLTISEGHNDGDSTTTTHVEYENQRVWLYPNYCQWCDLNGKQPVAKNEFSSVAIDVAKNLLNKTFVKYDRKAEGRSIVGMTLELPPISPYTPPTTPNPQPAPCQPMSTYDNLMSTQVIDYAELDNLENILEVTEFLKGLDEANSIPAIPESAEFLESAEIAEPCAEISTGCHSQHNQQDRLTLGCHPVDIGSSSTHPADALSSHQPPRPAPVDAPTDSPITRTILTTLAGRPAGMERDDLERAVNRAHPKAGALVPDTINALLLSGRIIKINGRLVLSTKEVRP